MLRKWGKRKAIKNKNGSNKSENEYRNMDKREDELSCLWRGVVRSEGMGEIYDSSEEEVSRLDGRII